MPSLYGVFSLNLAPVANDGSPLQGRSQGSFPAWTCLDCGIHAHAIGDLDRDFCRLHDRRTHSRALGRRHAFLVGRAAEWCRRDCGTVARLARVKVTGFRACRFAPLIDSVSVEAGEILRRDACADPMASPAAQPALPGCEDRLTTPVPASASHPPIPRPAPRRREARRRRSSAPECVWMAGP
jgi:hypothetical protein